VLKSTLEIEFEAVGYSMTVDLYNGVINRGPVKIKVNKAVNRRMIKNGFLR
jgi:hypothetical protein